MNETLIKLEKILERLSLSSKKLETIINELNNKSLLNFLGKILSQSENYFTKLLSPIDKQNTEVPNDHDKAYLNTLINIKSNIEKINTNNEVYLGILNIIRNHSQTNNNHHEIYLNILNKIQRNTEESITRLIDLDFTTGTTWDVIKHPTKTIKEKDDLLWKRFGDNLFGWGLDITGITLGAGAGAGAAISTGAASTLAAGGASAVGLGAFVGATTVIGTVQQFENSTSYAATVNEFTKELQRVKEQHIDIDKNLWMKRFRENTHDLDKTDPLSGGLQRQFILNEYEGKIDKHNNRNQPVPEKTPYINTPYSGISINYYKYLEQQSKKNKTELPKEKNSVNTFEFYKVKPEQINSNNNIYCNNNVNVTVNSPYKLSSEQQQHCINEGKTKADGIINQWMKDVQDKVGVLS